MSKNSGQIVKTSSGQTGKIFNNEASINGKVIVHLIDEKTFKPILDEKRREKKILSKPDSLIIKGFID